MWRLADAGIVVSVFIDADSAQVDAAHRIGARVRDSYRAVCPRVL